MQGPVRREEQAMLYGYKIMPCCRVTRHDWSRCFYVHPGERARRRCLHSNSYAAIMCPHVLHSGVGSCPNGDACPMAHNLFEYHMHPDKYRTKMCTSGADCKRNVCFYAHTAEELRVVLNSGTHSSPEPTTRKQAAPRNTLVSAGSSSAVMVSAAEWDSNKAATTPDAAGLAAGQHSKSKGSDALSSRSKGLSQHCSKSGQMFTVQASAAHAALTDLIAKQGASNSNSGCRDVGGSADMAAYQSGQSSSTSAPSSSGSGVESTSINCLQAQSVNSTSNPSSSAGADLVAQNPSQGDLNVSYGKWSNSSNSSRIPAALYSSLKGQFGRRSTSSIGGTATASSSSNAATSVAPHDNTGHFSSPTASSCSSFQELFCMREMHSQAHKQLTQQATQQQSSLPHWAKPGSEAKLSANYGAVGSASSQLVQLSLACAPQPSAATSDCLAADNMSNSQLQHDGSHQSSLGVPAGSSNSSSAPLGAGSSLFGEFSLFASSTSITQLAAADSSWGAVYAAAPLPLSNVLWSKLTPFQQQQQEQQDDHTQSSAAASSRAICLPAQPANLAAHAPGSSAAGAGEGGCDPDHNSCDPYYWRLCGHDWFTNSPEHKL